MSPRIALCALLSIGAASSWALRSAAAPDTPAPPAGSGTAPPAHGTTSPAAPAAASTPVPKANPGSEDAKRERGERQGIVRLERAGQLLGLGMVLRSDGRILTALSALGHGNYVQARFDDGTLSPVRVVLSDRAWDLALLTPDGGP